MSNKEEKSLGDGRVPYILVAEENSIKPLSSEDNKIAATIHFKKHGILVDICYWDDGQVNEFTQTIEGKSKIENQEFFVAHVLYLVAKKRAEKVRREKHGK